MEGVFWFVKDIEDDDYHIIFLTISADKSNFCGNSKNGLTYTHKLTWEQLTVTESKYIRKKAWNYFPRGRVDIKNGKASVYLNPIINERRYKDVIVDAFHLEAIPHRFVSDGSYHYKCGE